ncbi:hypothetical protein D3C85_1841070 [compost metagenome]
MLHPDAVYHTKHGLELRAVQHAVVIQEEHQVITFQLARPGIHHRLRDLSWLRHYFRTHYLGGSAQCPNFHLKGIV